MSTDTVYRLTLAPTPQNSASDPPAFPERSFYSTDSQRENPRRNQKAIYVPVICCLPHNNKTQKLYMYFCALLIGYYFFRRDFMKKTILHLPVSPGLIEVFPSTLI